MAQAARKILIAGAGCAGLSAGIALLKRGYDVTILEQSDRVGGLAGGIRIGENIYEYGPHIFHTTDPEVMADVKRIAGHVLIEFEKTIKIKFLGKYFDFPLSIPDILTKLPPPTVAKAVLSFGTHYAKGMVEGDEVLTDAEKVLRRYYGDVLYKIFFKDYISKVWGIEPIGMSASFARERIPRFDFLDFIDRLKKKVFGQKVAEVSTENYVEKVEGENYTTKQGFCLIAEAFADEFQRQGGKLKLNEGLTRVNVENGRFVSGQSSTGATYEGEHLISTIPIRLLPRMISPQPPQAVVETAEKLQFRAIAFVGLLVSRQKVLPASFMYFRDKSFNRITDLGQFEVEVKPDGSTILIAEITCQPGDPEWADEKGTAERVVEELIEEGLLKREEVLEKHVFKTQYGYPIYKVGYEDALKSTLQSLKASYPNIHSTGRQGKFAYINTHIAMKMGYEIAREIAR